MTQVAERQDTWTTAAEAVRQSPAAGPDWLRQIRADALGRFQARGFPTTRHEEWRFTNVAPIAASSFERAPEAAPERAALEPFLFAAGVPHQVVIVNGRFAPALSSIDGLPAGVTVRSLREVWEAGQGDGLGLAELRALFETPEGATPFVDLNTSLVEDGVVLHLAAKTVLEAPLHVLFVTQADRPVLVAPRVVVVAGEQSQAAIVESHAGLGAGGAFVFPVMQALVAPGAHIEHVKLQREPASTFHLASLFARVDRAGVFASRAITLGGRISRNDILATLAGEGAEVTLDGVYVADGETVVDTHSTIDHAEPHCPSHEVYKGILAGKARAVFNGKIIVRQKAQKTDAKQTNRALLLSDEAQINTKPQLEIFADDVKCTHGAAIGHLDEDQLFYLRARGIGEKQARNMLIHAFAGEVLDNISSETVREAAMQLIDEKLHLA